MAIEYLNELTWLSAILLLGIFGSIISYKLKIPDIIILIVLGVTIGVLTKMDFEQGFLTSFSIFALILIIFDSAAKFNPREIYSLSPYALKLAGVFLFVNMIILTFATSFLIYSTISGKFLILSALFAALMSGTAPESILSLLKDKKSKIIELIEFESILNTPIIVIIPLIILNFYTGVSQSAGIIATTLLKEVITGVGAGLVIGLIAFSIMRKYYQESISSLVLIAVSLLTYTLASHLGGNGVLAVTTLGIVYGVIRIREREELEKFSSLFTNFVKITVFVLLGVMIAENLSLTWIFVLKSFILFGLYVLSRYLSVALTFRNYNVTTKEKLFMTLTASKGVAVVVVAFIIVTGLGYENTSNLLNLIFMFVIYSIAMASIAVKFSDFFLQEKKSAKNKKLVQND